MKTEHEIPDNLGCYAVVKDGAAPNVLGKGEWGAVYKAFNSKLRCFAALRIIPHSAFPTEDAKQKFSADVRMATYIMGDRRLASVFPLEQTENAYLYGSELCNGKKLVDRMREGCLPPEAALSVARQIAEALDTIGKTGLLHHRITARNIMLDEGEDENDLRVKILDLALPRANSSESNAAAPLECDFRSPEEKIAGSAVDARSAIYTVGAVLYYMLAGSEKYSSLRPKASAKQDNWPDDSTNLSAGCAAVLEKTLCQDPAGRFQTFIELRELLDQVIDSPESFEAAQRELAQRRAQEEEDAKRRVQEEAEAARRAQEEEEARRRALEESARRRAQEEEEAQRRAQEREARLRAQEAEEAQRREQEKQARLRAQEEEEAQRKAQEEQARLRAQEEESARKKAQEEKAQRRAQDEAARRAAQSEKQRLAKLQAEQKRLESKPTPKPRDKVTRQADEDAAEGTAPWGWVGAIVIVVLGCLAGFYFWFGKPSQPEAVHQAVNPPAPVVQNPPASEQPSQVGPSPQPTPAVPAPLPQQPVSPTSGTLAIDTDPTGAHVTLDGKPPQTAPCTFSDISFGKHHFAVERDGYKRREMDLSFDGSPLAPIHLEPLPDPLQGFVDRIKAAPHDSPDALRASLDYLQQVKTQPPSRQLNPVKVEQDLSSALLDLEKKMISLPQYQHKEVYKDLLVNKVLEDARAADSVPATVMLADNAFGVDDSKSLDLFKSAANKNDRYAMRMLGKLYEQTQDAEKSKEWLNKASAAGDVYAHVLQLYNTLRGKNNDDPTAKPADALKELESDVEAWEKALAGGDSSIDLPTLGRAELLLGNYYYECYQNPAKQAAAEQSDPKDYRQMATDLYKKSTEHGEPLGYYGLGKMAMDAHDLAEAKVQFEKGAPESPACNKALAKLNQ